MTEKKEDLTNLPTINVGMVGHIDHGKTTLLYKLTGKWTDTHSEELKRGITIKLGYADCIIRKDNTGFNVKTGEATRYVTFIDAPGHEMLMATMLSGAAIMDAAILVIAANEGIKPQTREHLLALEAKKMKNIIIVQNKIDLVTREQAMKSYHDIQEFVRGTIAEKSPIIPCSAQQEININKILEALNSLEIPERDLKSEPVFVIARSFDINRPGTKIKELKGGVLGGVLKRGKLKVGDEIEIKPGISYKRENQLVYDSVKSRITGIFRGNHAVNEAGPGGSLSVETELDPILTKADALSGCTLGISGKLPAIVSSVRIKFNLFKEVLGMATRKQVDPVRMAELLMINVNSAITVGNVTKLKGNEFEMNLRIPIVPFKGENVSISRMVDGHWRLIGFGEIV